MLSCNIDKALQMLKAGWTVEYCEAMDMIEWRTPGGVIGSQFHSESLDSPPAAAVQHAQSLGHLRKPPILRTAAAETT
jgi:hypothetical protein